MRIMLIADGRSPITRAWVRSVKGIFAPDEGGAEGAIGAEGENGAAGHEIVLVSTFPCAPVEGVDADICLPVAFSALGGSASGALAAPASGGRSAARSVVQRFRPLLLSARYLLGPQTLRYYGPRLRWLVERMEPDLVHALRIPYEGMLAAWTPPGIPMAVSIWGNDLTLHAAGSGQMAALTHRALARADGLAADAARDLRLAREWGFSAEKPSLVAPGSGGLDLDLLDAARSAPLDGLLDGVGPDAPLVINPRGFRTGSVRSDTFFQSIPLVLERRPDTVFACAAMAGQREALDWVERLGLQGKVRLLPHLPQASLWALFHRAAVTVSVSQHDGTPNSLLEAMAAGAFPVAGDIESLREWITPGVNGLLVEPDKPQALAEAVLLALENDDLRRRAAAANRRIVIERAGLAATRGRVAAFYRQLVSDTGPAEPPAASAV